MIYATSLMLDLFSNPARDGMQEDTQLAKHIIDRIQRPTIICRSVHLLLLVNAERPRAHIDQQEEPAAVRMY